MTQKQTCYATDEFVGQVGRSVIMCELMEMYSILSTDVKWIIISPQNIEQNDIDIPVDLLKPTMVKCSMERQWYFECIF